MRPTSHAAAARPPPPIIGSPCASSSAARVGERLLRARNSDVARVLRHVISRA